MAKNYREKLTDPRWQKRRLKVLEYANWRCQLCGNSKEELHCHHSYYQKGKQPWQYPDGAIIALCATCHEKQHPEKHSRPTTEAVEPLPHPSDDTPERREKSAATFDEIFKMLGKI